MADMYQSQMASGQPTPGDNQPGAVPDVPRRRDKRNHSKRVGAKADMLSIAVKLSGIKFEEEQPGSTILVDNAEGLQKAVLDLSGNAHDVALDCEGVNLGRKKGSLSIVTISGLDPQSLIYVVDVLKLGGERTFSTEEPSLRSVLEDSGIKKVMFDCRTDSDALKHQFDVTLAGVLDLQVFDQAIRIQGGEAPPRRSPILKEAHFPFLQSMVNVLQRYPGCVEMKCEKSVGLMVAWNQRPLPAALLEYAAADVKVIKSLLVEMRRTSISADLTEAVDKHSKLREDVFRGSESDVQMSYSNKTKIIEKPIISDAALPVGHLRRDPPLKGHPGEKWDETIGILKQSSVHNPKAFNLTQYILQHDDWYTDYANERLRCLCKAYPFTVKQRSKIAFPPNLRNLRRDDEYDHEYDYDSD